MKKAEIPVIDLHSDLLSYLARNPNRSPEDPDSRSSYSQLSQGHVKLQTLAIFCKTEKNSIDTGRKQVDCFLKLIAQFPNCFTPYRFPLNAQKTTISLLPAFESAAAFASGEEPLADAIQRLEGYRKALGHIFYISLTWEEENRFGGGNRSNVGLKEEGKRFLEWMHGKKIALDFSHTSDKLGYDLLNFIDSQSLNIPVIASHSNFRSVTNCARNLPDEIAKEIIRRKGLIGLNLFAPLIDETDPSVIVRHVEYGLELGGENVLCFGADFFCDTDFPDFLQEKYQRIEAFYPAFSNASAYPDLLHLFSQKLDLKEHALLKIASQNALNFLSKLA